MCIKREYLWVSALIAGVIVVAGCGGSKPGSSLVKRVNADDKHFWGVWVYKSSFGGGFSQDVVRTSMSIAVSGTKFHLKGDWINMPPAERGTEEWLYDGKVLWQPVPAQKQVNFLEAKGLMKRKVPFWKMPSQMQPLGPFQEAGAGEVAERKTTILKITGEYEGAEVSLTYWIDQEKGVLLKKEHILGPIDDPLVKETYECKSIKFDTAFPEETFSYKIPSDYVKMKVYRLSSNLLDTKF